MASHVPHEQTPSSLRRAVSGLPTAQHVLAQIKSTWRHLTHRFRKHHHHHDHPDGDRPQTPNSQTSSQTPPENPAPEEEEEEEEKPTHMGERYHRYLSSPPRSLGTARPSDFEGVESEVLGQSEPLGYQGNNKVLQKLYHVKYLFTTAAAFHGKRATAWGKDMLKEHMPDSMVGPRRTIKKRIEPDRYVAYTKNNFPGLCDMVDSTRFESAMAVPIVINCITIGLAADCWECMPLFHRLAENILTVVFVIELAVRLAVFGPKWVKKPFNAFDTFLVIFTGVIVVWILDPLGMINPIVRRFQVLRTARLMRIARVLRVNPMFKEMWMLVKGLAESIRTLLWSGVIIFFVHFIFGVFMTEVIGKSDAYGDTDEDLFLQGCFKDLGSSMFTLFQFMTLDSWSAIARPVNERQPGIWVLFFSYIAVAVFVLMNLVTAVIVNNAMELTKKDEEQVAKLKEKDQEKEYAELERVFRDLDDDGSGKISQNEWAMAFQVPGVSTKIKNIGFEEHELDDLFRIIDDDGSGEIGIDEFKQTLRRLKGDARAKELMETLSTCTKCETIMRNLSEGEANECPELVTVGERCATLARRLEAIQDHLDREEASSEVWDDEKVNQQDPAVLRVELLNLGKSYEKRTSQITELTAQMTELKEKERERELTRAAEVEKLTKAMNGLQQWSRSVDDKLSALCAGFERVHTRAMERKNRGKLATGTSNTTMSGMSENLRFELQQGRLIMFVNGQKQAGENDTSGVVSQLSWVPQDGGGGIITTQHGYGGYILDKHLPSLKSMATTAGVTNNIPAPPTVTGTPQQAPSFQFPKSQLARAPTADPAFHRSPMQSRSTTPLGSPMKSYSIEKVSTAGSVAKGFSIASDLSSTWMQANLAVSETLI